MEKLTRGVFKENPIFLVHGYLSDASDFKRQYAAYNPRVYSTSQHTAVFQGLTGRVVVVVRGKNGRWHTATGVARYLFIGDRWYNAIHYVEMTLKEGNNG